jgi:hypothetical protein
MEVYKRETRDLVDRFIIRRLSFATCISRLDAALVHFIPRLQPEQLGELRTVMLANNARVMKEMATRPLHKEDGATSARHWYIDCKECARRITLEIYSAEAAFGNRLSEVLTCPTCLKESMYSGDDFKTATLF